MYEMKGKKMYDQNLQVNVFSIVCYGEMQKCLVSLSLFKQERRSLAMRFVGTFL